MLYDLTPDIRSWYTMLYSCIYLYLIFSWTI